MLVVSQVALTLMLLVGTGLLLRSFERLLEVAPGYRTAGAVVLNCHLPYPDTEEQAERQERFHDRLIARLRALPGVAEIGGVDALPLRRQGANGTFLLLGRPDEVTDLASFEAVAKIPGRAGYAEYRRATPGYFRAMQIPLLRGRVFDERDHPEAPHVALISESLAEKTWPGEDPLGKLVQYGNMDGDLRPFTVVGIVGDIHDASLVVRQGLPLAALGVALGLAGALAMTRLMQSLLYRVTTTDPATFLAVPVLLAVAALLACLLPARRAARVDPVIALRAD